MIYTVFSTTDSPYMQWQSELLEFSWKQVEQPGELIRLVATDKPASIPQHRYARCVATRPWQIHPYTGDNCATYNKPASLLEWIYRERPSGTILLVDPDCVFRRRIDREVAPGQAVGQHWIDLQINPDTGSPFGLGERFAGVLDYCANTAVSADPVMIPNLIHTVDMQRIALRWLELTGVVRQKVRNHLDSPMWESDMFGFIMACAEYGLQHELASLGICTNWSEQKVRDAPIIHYCQKIVDRNDQSIWSKGTYQPWQAPPDPSLATTDYGRDLLTLLGQFVDQLEATSESYPRRRPGVIERLSAENQVELIAPQSKAGVLLNFSAEAVWRLCDGERSADAIAEELAMRFDIGVTDIAADVKSSIASFGAAGLLA